MKKFLDCISVVGTTPSRFQGKRKYVSTGAVATTEINESEVVEVTYEDRPSRANLSAESGDILFAKMQGTRKTLLLDSETEENIYSTGFYAVRANPDVITTECLYYLIDSELFLTQKDKHCSGATQKAITNGGLAKIEIRVPPLSEQGILTVKLRYLTQLIVDKRKQLELLDEVIKSRFIEMFGDPIANEKGWSMHPLEDVCKTIVDCPHSTPNYTNEDTGYMCIRTSIVKKNRILWDDIEYISQAEYQQRIQRKRPEKGDIVYTREGAILGIAAVIDRDCNVALGQRSMLLSPNTGKCLPHFLSVAMNFDSFLNKALGGISGSASPHINVGDIKAFSIILPPIELQRQYVELIEQTDKSKFEIQQSLEKLEILKKSLMQQYFG